MLVLIRTSAWIAVAAWLGLVVARGRFWDARADCLAESGDAVAAPDVHVVIPARDEADVIAETLASVLAQDYRGRMHVTVVDDRSEDGTGDVARATIDAAGETRARVHAAAARPDGWTGKVWAMECGITAARAAHGEPAFWWLTDADVVHPPDTLARLVATAEGDRRDLVSLMVALHCTTTTERVLIPAFVFFFCMLYPFAWVNDRTRATAGAAGGCVLLRAPALERIGGMTRIRGALIDDCSLAAAVAESGGALWLGLSARSRSIRRYDGIGAIWSMVARTAYTQLRYSPSLLAGTVAAMAVLYVAPVAALAAGVRARRFDVALPGAVAWSILAAAYAPTVALYRAPRAFALTLPLAGLLYTAMTVDSARRHAIGAGGRWKGRTFSA